MGRVATIMFRLVIICMVNRICDDLTPLTECSSAKVVFALPAKFFYVFLDTNDMKRVLKLRLRRESFVFNSSNIFSTVAY